MIFKQETIKSYSIKVNGIINTLFNASTINTKIIQKYNAEIEKAVTNNATMSEKQQIKKIAMEDANKTTALFPSLIQGWTDEGNAILNLKGNVDQLRDSYKEAQQEAYNTLIASG